MFTKTEPARESLLAQEHILELERRGLVRRTFRRLDPERQRAVLQAILDEAAERGPAELRIKEVAHRAGVSVGSLYQYFGNHQNLLRFTGELTTHVVLATLDQVREETAALPLREGLQAYLQGALAWHRQPVGKALLRLVRELLQRAQARGELRSGVDVEAAARLVYALLIALVDTELLPHLNAYFQTTGEGVDRERVTAGFLSLVDAWLVKPRETGGALAAPPSTGGGVP